MIGSPTWFRMDVVNDLGAATDFNQFSYIRIRYPREYKLGGNSSFQFTLLHAVTQPRTLVDFEGYPQAAPLFYDLTSGHRVRGFADAGHAKAVFPYASVSHEVFLFDSSSIQPVTTLEPVSFRLIDPAQNYIFLIISNPLLAGVSADYENYRSQKYKTLRVYAQELYDAYMYGNLHPLAVRRFAAHLLAQAPVKPKYLLLAGRGYQTDFIRTNPAYFNANLVPSIGVPSSDMMFTAGLTGTGFEPDIATGRIAADEETELRNYLDKLKEYEDQSKPRELWQKKVIHVSGGIDENQQKMLKNSLIPLEQVIHGKFFGGEVIRFAKDNPDYSSTKDKLRIRQELNQGVAIATFLGHGSSSVLDVDIGTVHDLDASHKYSFYFFNGCNIGNPNAIDPSAGQFYAKDYVCAQAKGAIAWLSHANETNTGDLSRQMGELYTRLGVTMYGSPIGDIIQAASRQMGLTMPSAETMKSHSLQWLLQADPAVVVSSPLLPDYKVDAAAGDVLILPENVNNLTDSFQVGVIISNVGMATDDTIEVSLTRILPDQSRRAALTQRLTHQVYHHDTIYFWIASKGDPLTVGNNKFEVVVDASNEVDELDNIGNNTTVFEKYFAGSGIQPLFPVEYGLVNKNQVDLVVQNNDFFVQNASYIFEIDTVPLDSTLHSGAYQTAKFTSGSIARWPVTLPATTDTVAYYWRARLDLPPQQGGEFVTSSFTYVSNGYTGWGQSRYPQYNRVGAADKIEFDKVSGAMEFNETSALLTLLVRRWEHAALGMMYPYYITDQAFMCNNFNNGLIVVLFNPKTLKQMENPRFPFNCPFVANSNFYYYYLFETNTPAGEAEFIRFIDSVDTGVHVAIISRYNMGAATWSQAMRDRLASLGSVVAANARSYYTAMGLVGTKGALPGTILEDTVFNNKYESRTALDADTADLINIVAPIRGRGFTGSITSRPIGPVKKWDKVFFRFVSTEDGAEAAKVDVFAKSVNGTDTTLFSNVSSGADISSLNPYTFRQLQLKATFTDTNWHTPAQFGYWMVTADPAPEGTISPDDAFSFHNNVIEQGDSVRLTVAFRNISPASFDSVPYQLEIRDANRTSRYAFAGTFARLDPDSVLVLQHNISTNTLQGRNQLVTSFNGKNTVPEITLVNNFLQSDFTVNTDRINPLLDVTFDGYRIMNGDFVSATPVIRITSKDNNEFRLQDDTTTFQVFLSQPGSSQPERVSLASPEVTFTPGTAEGNKAMLEFRPSKLADGTYTLTVQSKDAVGNYSGNNAYTIDFVVVNQSTITHFYPYPNPCTTNMRFVFTLTGSKPPDELLIRISTMTGRIVREVQKTEFGAIHIGNNISEWAWDGTDQYGDRLANGVYLYQVFTKLDGDEVMHRTSDAEKKNSRLIINNTGKIYLMH
jgi:hypothetical protein